MHLSQYDASKFKEETCVWNPDFKWFIWAPYDTLNEGSGENDIESDEIKGKGNFSLKYAIVWTMKYDSIRKTTLLRVSRWTDRRRKDQHIMHASCPNDRPWTLRFTWS